VPEAIPAPGSGPKPSRLRRPVPMGRQMLLGLGVLLALLAVSMLAAIALVVGLRHDENGLNDRDLPYASAIATAALAAKGIANDQRGFLLTGDRTFIEEADRRVGEARTAFDTATKAAADGPRRQAVSDAQAGFEGWIRAVHDEFAMFEAGDHTGAVSASLGPDRELRKTYEQSLGNAETLAASSIKSATNSVTAALSRSVWILVAGLLVALVVGLGVSWWLMRTIATPLFGLVDLLRPELS
jgi:methyl-accepting chemotaxis protein